MGDEPWHHPEQFDDVDACARQRHRLIHVQVAEGADAEADQGVCDLTDVILSLVDVHVAHRFGHSHAQAGAVTRRLDIVALMIDVRLEVHGLHPQEAVRASGWLVGAIFEVLTNVTNLELVFAM